MAELSIRGMPEPEFTAGSELVAEVRDLHLSYRFGGHRIHAVQGTSLTVRRQARADTGMSSSPALISTATAASSN